VTPPWNRSSRFPLDVGLGKLISLLMESTAVLLLEMYGTMNAQRDSVSQGMAQHDQECAKSSGVPFASI
jgi:hypothetical protein